MFSSGKTIKDFMQDEKSSLFTIIAVLLVIALSVIRVVGGDEMKGRGIEPKDNAALERVVFSGDASQKCVSVVKLEAEPENENEILISLRNVIAGFSGMPSCET